MHAKSTREEFVINTVGAVRICKGVRLHYSRGLQNSVRVSDHASGVEWWSRTWRRLCFLAACSCDTTRGHCCMNMVDGM